MLGLDVIVGSIVGSVSAIATQYMKGKGEAAKREHSLKVQELGLKERRIEMEHELDLQDKGIEVANAEGEWQAFNSAQVSMHSGNKWVQIWQVITRMAITGVLMFTVLQLAQGITFTAEMMSGHAAKIIDSVMTLTATAVSFWFGTRR